MHGTGCSDNCQMGKGLRGGLSAAAREMDARFGRPCYYKGGKGRWGNTELGHQKMKDLMLSLRAQQINGSYLHFCTILVHYLLTFNLGIISKNTKDKTHKIIR